MDPHASLTLVDGAAHIDTDQYSAVVRPEGYVSGVVGGSFVDKRTGKHDLGHGLDIVDFLMQPGRHPREAELLADQQYNANTLVHGPIKKHYVELPQICTQAKKIPMETIQGKGFVAVKQHWTWTVATPGYEAGSRWEQTLVFPAGKRYFYSADAVISANDAEQLLLRIDLPGHLKHDHGDTFEELYLSYHGRFPAEEFFEDFTPEAKCLYGRPEGIAESIIRGYKIRGGPWLAGMVLDPSLVWEAWCHQRGYVCFILELGGCPVRRGETLSAAHVIGFFDTIEEMHAVYEEHRGVSALTADESRYALRL